MVIICRAGITYCLSESFKNQESNPALAEVLKAQAKTIAFDVAANSWPAWGDEGVIIVKDDTVKGLEFAKLNLQLAFDLKKNG